MTGKQRALAAFRGERQDRVPVIPLVGQAAAGYAGFPSATTRATPAPWPAARSSAPGASATTGFTSPPTPG